MTTRTVGPSGTYPGTGAGLMAAIAAAVSGDAISVDPAGNPYLNVAVTVTKNLAFRSSVPGTFVKLDSNQWVANDKGYFVIQATVSFDWFDITGVNSYIANVAAFRFESGNLTLTNCYIHDYFGNGYLLTPLNDDGTVGDIVIDKCKFSNLGFGDGLTHLGYAGRVKSLTVTNSLYENINPGGGNLCKTRAKASTISNTRIFANLSDAIWEIDFSNGGVVNVSNSVIQQGSNDSNTNIISMGPERDINGPNWPVSSATFQSNTIINDLDNGALYYNPFSIATTWTDTKVWAANGLALPSGMVNTTVLASRPVLDYSDPWAATAPPPTPQAYTAGIAEVATLADHPSGISASNQVALGERVTAADTWTSRAAFGSGVTDSLSLQEASVSGGNPLLASLTEVGGSPVDTLSSVYTPAIPPAPSPPPVPPPIPIPPQPPSGSPNGTPKRRSTSALAESRKVVAHDPGSRRAFSVKRS